MEQKQLQIQHIPAILWGEKSDKLFIAVHGNLSHKADHVIESLAMAATKKGFQVLSFDLPEHGDRKSGPTLCKVQVCVKELRLVLDYARTLAEEINLFGCSIGAYFSLLAYQNEPLKQAILLSPVVDMERLVQNMMTWFSVSEKRLQKEQEIATPMGQTLYWDYYCYVKEHPVTHWTVPTNILYGAADNLCEQEVVSAFSEKHHCHLTTLEQGEHFFHTPEQLAFYKTWLEKLIP